MTRFVPTFAAGLPVAGLTAQTFAEAIHQTIDLAQTNPAIPATDRLATVYGDAGDNISKLKHVIITDAGTVPCPAVSFGDFWGMDAHCVVVAATGREPITAKLPKRETSRETLKALPNLTFTT